MSRWGTCPKHSTDQKVGGSSPSERAQVNGHFRPWNVLWWIFVQQCLAVKLLSQPPKRLAGGLVGDLGVNLHRDCDLTVAEYPHRYPRVHVEGGQQRGAGSARSVGRDVADLGSTAP